jgi:hypothetical protein
MSRPIDETGKRFNRLLVIERLKNDKRGRASWLCKCDCGNETIVGGSTLRAGHTKSCGCIETEYRQKFGQSNVKHGHARLKTRHPLHYIWACMLQRCYNKKSQVYKYYGGRGISICDKWKNDYMSFHNDMIRGYDEHIKVYGKKNTSIERVDNNGNYTPSNCKWATRAEQCINQRRILRYSYNGLTLSIREWADRIGIKRSTLKYRIQKARWTIKRALLKK